MSRYDHNRWEHPEIAIQAARLRRVRGTARPVLPVGALYVKDISIAGFAITYATIAEMRACADRLNALTAAGHLSAKVAITLPLSEARRAHEMIEDKDLRLDGKIIVVPP